MFNALIWTVRIIIFGILLVFALHNMRGTSVDLVFWPALELPLVLVILGSFALGVVLGALSQAGFLIRNRLEIARLKQNVKRLEQAEKNAQQQAAVAMQQPRAAGVDVDDVNPRSIF